MVTVVIIAALIALAFNFMNGMNDAANAIATVVATKALTPKRAVWWAGFWIFISCLTFFFIEPGVAQTMGKGIVQENCIDHYVILAALLGSVLWIYTCTMMGLPISASHALIGGLIGPVWFGYGFEHLILSGIGQILLFIVLSPLIGMVLGFFMRCFFMWLFKVTGAHPAPTDKALRRAQLFSSALFSFSFGLNDGQKTMGVIAILLCTALAQAPDNGLLQILYNVNEGQFVPYWLMIISYLLISMGTIIGGWKVIRTLGSGLAKVTPLTGFCSEIGGSATLIITAILGIPVSTTHTVTGAIVGTGLTQGVKSVKWMTAKNIVWAWIITIPAVIIVSGLIYKVMLLCGAPLKAI
ncbi:MAG: inorganic phosphate transporter [Bacteroidales bacterium]|nr:inorganic phosphate transporter [Candidatus Cacconaster equifaecalis]